jgi:uncharacterized protein (DUF1778 family)
MAEKPKIAHTKPGRPRGSATKRISPRFPVGVVEKIEYAAALRGVSVSAFVQEAVAERADRVIEAESRWELARDEALAIANLVASPPKPNKVMLDAAKSASRHVVIRP